ncbi:MAG: GspE/PulE family protein [Patescibacteria group bacterium]
MVSRQVTDILKKEGFLNKDSLQRLKEYEKSRIGNVLDFCADQNIAPVANVVALLRQTHQQPVVDLTQIEIDLVTAKRLPSSICFEHTIIPFYEDGDKVYVAMANPDNEDLVRFVEQKIGKSVEPYLAHQGTIKHILQLTFNHSAEDSRAYIQELIERAKNVSHSPEVMAQQVPIISLVNHLVLFALRSKASDMHIEPRSENILIRLRIDGQLHELFNLPKEILASLVARIKILSRLRIDEHMRPQDGRFSFIEAGYRIAIRVSIIPTLYGQKVALRFLDTDNEELSVDSLGLHASHRQQMKKLLGFSNGMILVTGPTGSGKTTTLYALLKAIAQNKVNISTIEDPIEYHLPGANQVQVNPQVGLSFAEGLRSLLRQDPDIIMVGEIRDRETAMIAVNAALTGHLVLSSLHTNNAVSAIPRLLDMGVEPYLVASTVRAVIGQRLARKICPDCARDITLEACPDIFSAEKNLLPKVVSTGQGCSACLGTGYRGRIGIFELLEVNDSLHDLIVKRAPVTALTKASVQKGFSPLAHDGLRKIADRVTTVEEIIRIIK